MIGLLRRLVAAPPVLEDRVLQLRGQSLSYRLRRSARRTLAMRLDAAGLRVSAPLRASLAEVESFVLQHADWLLQRLAERDADLALTGFAAVDGARFPLYGKDCVLRIDAGRQRARWSQDAAGEVLQVGDRDPAAAVLRALRRRALPDYTERVRQHCVRLGVPVPAVRLTSARTRWGSCSARSGIRLHWRLLHLAPELIDYVVAHEVAHLVEMNHSPRFWTIVGTLHPDWQASRSRLREHARTLPVIQPGSGAAPEHED